MDPNSVGEKKNRAYYKAQKRELADVEEIIYMYDTGEQLAYPWVGFSIFFADGQDPPLHLICEDENMVDGWFLGLQTLIGLTRGKYLTHGSMLWQRFKMKIIYMCDTHNFESDFHCLKVFLEEVCFPPEGAGESEFDILKGGSGIHNKKKKKKKAITQKLSSPSHKISKEEKSTSQSTHGERTPSTKVRDDVLIANVESKDTTDDGPKD